MDCSNLAVSTKFLLAILFTTISLAIESSGAPLLTSRPPPFYCRLNEARCPSGIQSCVHVLGICNGIRDCPDGSDESPRVCKSYNCSNRDLRIVGIREEDETGVPYWQSSKCPSGNICTKKPTFEYIGDVLGPDEEHPQVFFKCTGGPRECADGSDENKWFCRNLDCSKGGDKRVATCPSKKYCLYPEINTGTSMGADRLCDGSRDCPDGSDEWPSFCKKHGCSPKASSTFRCKDFGCVKTNQICNGVKDCGDGSDEDPTFCASYKCSWSGGNKCPDRRTCLKKDTICDGKKNCPDGSDEGAVRCRSLKCAGGKWKCKDGVQCAGEWSTRFWGIIEDPRCDSKFDCNDKSDETSTLCKTFDCGRDRAKCPGNGACIGRGKLCDGTRDCLDESDESKTFCAKYECDVEYSQVKCKRDNLCTWGGYCDGHVDCDDKTDEDPAFCAMYKCPKGFSKCHNFPYQCVRNEYLCDGRKKQCINGGDENPTFCKSHICPGVKCGLKCQDGRFCDGYNDCPDGSDERPDFCRNYRCPKGYVKCKDGKKCVNHSQLCS